MFLCYLLLIGQISFSVLCKILGNMCITTAYKPGCDAMNFGVTPIFLIKPFFSHDQNVMTKTEIS